jgi:hypothetical protein
VTSGEGTPGDGDPSEPGRGKRRVEIAATVLLSAATVLTAWSAFQSTKWSGVQAIRFSQASASRTESVRASTVAGQQTIADVTVFTAWLTATDEGHTQLAGLLAARFRGEFKAAFEAWESTSPLTSASAPATPFAMPGYELANSRQATQLEATASTQFSQATEANQRADNYILLTVLFALVLFFGAVSTRFDSRGLQIALLSVGAIVFVVVAVITALFPVEF